MAEIERREKGYRVRWYEAGKRRSRACPDLKSARRVSLEVERQLAERGYANFEPPPDPPSLVLALARWLEACHLSLRPRTVSHYQDAARLLLRYAAGLPSPDTEHLTLDGVPLTAIRENLLPGFHAWLLRAGRAPSTAAKRCGTVRLFWEWATTINDFRPWLPVAPRRLGIKKPPPPAPRAPSWAEADACLAVLTPGTWLHRFAILARYTGGRRSSLLLLTWDDVDMEAETLCVRPEVAKGGRGWTAPLCPPLVAELAGWGIRTGYLVDAPPLEVQAARGDGRGHVDRDLRRAWTRAKVPADRWKGQPSHAFRKCIETGLVAAGARWDAVEAFVGHQLPGTGGAHYVDRERALWDAMVEAAAMIPAIGTAGVFVAPAEQGSGEGTAPPRPHSPNEETPLPPCNADSEDEWRRAMGILQAPHRHRYKRG